MDNKTLAALSEVLARRHELSQMLISNLKDFKDGPRTITVPYIYTPDDVKAVVPILEKLGYRIELQFPPRREMYLRVYKG